MSGVLPLDRTGTRVQGDTIEQQTELVLTYIGKVLATEGLRHEDVVQSTVYLTDLREFAAMNGVYARYFPSEPPARTTVQVSALALGAKLEISVIAAR